MRAARAIMGLMGGMGRLGLVGRVRRVGLVGLVGLVGKEVVTKIERGKKVINMDNAIIYQKIESLSDRERAFLLSQWLNE